MPYRTIKDSICTSDTLAKLSADEERLFYRLMVKADDFGRFDGRADVVRAACFPLQLDQYSTAHVEKMLRRLAEVDLIRFYVVSGRRYLYFTTWEKHQRKRAKYSKYPSPDQADAPVAADGKVLTDDGQMTDTSLASDGQTDSDEDCSTQLLLELPQADRDDKFQHGKRHEYPEEFESFWSAYPRKIGKREAFRNWETRRKRDRISPEDMVKAAQHYAEECRLKGTDIKYIKHPATFLGPNMHFLEYVDGIPEAAGIKTPSKKPSPQPREAPSWIDKELERLNAASV